MMSESSLHTLPDLPAACFPQSRPLTVHVSAAYQSHTRGNSNHARLQSQNPFLPKLCPHPLFYVPLYISIIAISLNSRSPIYSLEYLKYNIPEKIFLFQKGNKYINTVDLTLYSDY